MIKIQITLNDKKAQARCNRINEFNLIEQNEESVKFIVKEFKKFLEDNAQPMSYENADCGLKITWCK